MEEDQTLNKPYRAEYAKSSRSNCKACKTQIEKDVLRLGVMVQVSLLLQLLVYTNLLVFTNRICNQQLW